MVRTHVLALAMVNAFGALAQLPNGYFGYENQRWSECTNYYSTCKPTRSACAKGLCAQCYSFGGVGFKSCCNQPTPYVCFQSAAGVGANQITASPPPVTNVQQLACQTAADIIQSCESATSGFDNLDDNDAASCLCYSGTHWQPQSFDQPWSSCIAWASTADVSDYANWNSVRGFCSRIGQVVNSPATVVATTTAVATQNVGTTAGTGTSQTLGANSETTTTGLTTSASTSVPKSEAVTAQHVKLAPKVNPLQKFSSSSLLT